MTSEAKVVTLENTVRSAASAPLYRRQMGRALLEAAHGELQAGDALLAAHHRRVAAADRGEEGDQLGAQRLVVADREMPHRIAAVGLEAEAFGDLARQQ